MQSEVCACEKLSDERALPAGVESVADIIRECAANCIICVDVVISMSMFNIRCGYMG